MRMSVALSIFLVLFVLNSTFKGASVDFVPFLCYFHTSNCYNWYPSIDVKEKMNGRMLPAGRKFLYVS